MATQFAVDLVFKQKGGKQLDDLSRKLKGIDGAAAGAANGIRGTGRAAASATANVQRFGIAFRSVLGPLVAVTGAVTFFSRSLKVLGERQADIAALKNGLKGLTTDGNAALESLIKSADKLGKQTLFNEEDFTKAFKLLTSFRTIGVSTYERVGTVAADMAQVLGQDVTSVMLQVAKALEAPEVGLTALQRSGTRFTEQQKELVKEMVAAGQTAEAQAYILKELERQYGGAAKAAGSAGFAGAMDSLGEEFRDFQETVGRIIEPIATGFVNALKAAIVYMNRAYQGLEKLLGAFSPLGAVLDSVGINWENFSRAADMAGRIVSVVANDIAYALKQMVQVVANILQGLIGGIQQFFGNFVNLSAEGMRGTVQNVANGVRAIRDLIASLINALPPAAVAKFLGFDVGQFATGGLGAIADGIEGAFSYAESVVSRAKALDFGSGGVFKDIRGAAELGGGDGTGGGGGAGQKLKDQAAELKKIDDAYKRIFESISQSGQSLSSQLEDQKRLNALLLEGFDSDAAQKQVSFERQIKDIQTERAAKLQELRAIEGLELQKLQTGEAEINRLYDERVQKAFALNQAKEQGNQLTEQALAKQQQMQAQMQMEQQLLDGIGGTIANGIGSAIDAVASGTEDLGKTLQKLGQQILAQVAKMLIFYALAQAFGALAGPSGGGIFGALAKGFGFNFGGGKSDGGPVEGGKSYLVGENGPEILNMSPDGSGGYVYNNRETSKAMSRYRPGSNSTAAGGAIGGEAADGEGGNDINVSYTVERINERNYVTEEQFRQGMNQAAKRGAQGGYAKTMGSLRNSRSSRARVGL